MGGRNDDSANGAGPIHISVGLARSGSAGSRLRTCTTVISIEFAVSLAEPVLQLHQRYLSITQTESVSSKRSVAICILPLQVGESAQTRMT